MNATEKRDTRIRLLTEIYIRTDYSEDAVIARAIKMGVEMNTAKSYLSSVKARVERMRSKNGQK